jgi:LacI family transcriptional regulator
MKNSLARPTIHDVAADAKVSLATVDRVLNARGGVAEKSIKRVHDAVARLGYVRDVSAANLSRNREYRFTFILPDSASGFVELLRQALGAEQTRLRAEKVRIDVVATRAFDVEAQVAALKSHSAQTTDGIALIAAEAPEVQREITRLMGEGVHIVTLVADLPHSGRDAYVGPDNVVAGRTAASFMGRFVGTGGGDILMVTGSLAARDHMERVMGFRAVIQEQFGALNLLPATQSYDDAETLSTLVKDAMDHHNLRGVYAVGAGHRGLLDALQNGSVKPIVIAHELTDISQRGLRSGAIDLVIDQNPAAEVRAAVDLMRDLSDGRMISPATGSIPLNIFVRENI